MLPGFPPLVTELLAPLDARQARGSDTATWSGLVADLDGWGRRVLNDDAARARLIRLLVAEHDLDRQEIRWCLGYLYAHLVNKYQGSVAEFLAARELSVWLSEEIAADRLGADVMFVAGDNVREWCGGRRTGRWDRGADGLVVVDPGEDADLAVVAIVEVKSYPATFASIARQLERHLARLRRGGLRIGAREWAPTRLSAAWWDRRRGWRTGTADSDWTRALRLLVTPRPGAGRRNAEASSAYSHNIQLTASKTLLAAVAYDLTVRFLEGLGAEAFKDGSPWPEMTAEEAAANAVKQALYHIIREERADEPTFARIARRLYNVYGFGYAASEGHRAMLWPDGQGGLRGGDEPSPAPAPDPPAGSSLADLMEGAWAHYRAARLDAAEVWARAAVVREDDDETGDAPRRIAWLRGMLRFYQADFAGACEFLPDPGEKPAPDDGWWAKDLLTLVRARTRSGSLSEAEALLDRLGLGGSKWDHLQVALPVARGWIALERGDASGAATLADRAAQALTALREDAADRERRGLGEPPWRDVGALQAAVVDLAALQARRARHEEATALLEPMEGLFRPLLALVQVDPAFAPVRGLPGLAARLSSWLSRNGAER